MILEADMSEICNSGTWSYVDIPHFRIWEILSLISGITQVPEETNILTDGCLIDLCGVTLMWRTAIGLEQGPVRIQLQPKLSKL